MGPHWLTEYLCVWMMHINTALCVLSDIQGPSVHHFLHWRKYSIGVSAQTSLLQGPLVPVHVPCNESSIISPRLFCASALIWMQKQNHKSKVFLPKLLHCGSKAVTRPLLLPGQFKWRWLKLRMGAILSVLLKHAVKLDCRKRRNAIKTVLLYKWDLAGLPQLPQQPFFPPFFLWQWALKRPQRSLYADQRNSFYKQARRVYIKCMLFIIAIVAVY